MPLFKMALEFPAPPPANAQAMADALENVVGTTVDLLKWGGNEFYYTNGHVVTRNGVPFAHVMVGAVGKSKIDVLFTAMNPGLGFMKTVAQKLYLIDDKGKTIAEYVVEDVKEKGEKIIKAGKNPFVWIVIGIFSALALLAFILFKLK